MNVGIIGIGLIGGSMALDLRRRGFAEKVAGVEKDPVNAEAALKMADDRNLTAHTYDEKLAVELAERIMDYEKLLAEWFRRMKE